MGFMIGIGILVVLVFHLGIRLFLLHKSLEKLTDDFVEVIGYEEAERNLQLDAPDKKLERLTALMNQHISREFTLRYEQQQSMRKIRNEIINISHDLRTPLTSILGYLELLEQEDNTKEERGLYVSVVKRRSYDLYELVQQLYEYARLENQEYSITREPLDLHRLCKEHLLHYYMEFEEKGLEPEISIGESPIYILGDPECLKRVLQNLTSNTLKYSKTKVSISLMSEGQMAVVTYKNADSELSEQDACRLFDRYYQKNTTKSPQSSGLGLTITKLLVERMDGEIEAAVKEGSLLIMCRLPLQEI